MRWAGPLGVAAMLFFSGCAAAPGEGPSAAPTSQVVGPATFGSDTGAVDGLVVDEELRPLVGAEVLLREAERASRTDDRGRFVFSDVAPGTYTLVVAHLGAESRATRVQVRPGEASIVQVTLALLTVEEPRVVTLQQKGLAGCFLAYRVPGGTNQNVYCGHAQSEVGRNKHLIYWPAIKPMGGWSGSVFEMVWRSTQAGGQGMQGKIYIAYEGKLCGGFELVFFEGVNPLRGTANASQTAEFLENASRDCAKVCNFDSCELMSWVGGVPHVAGPSAPADVGLLFEQSYEQYHTAFFSQEAPAAFSALPDA